MLGFEPQIGSVGSHCSVNCATECLVLQIVVYGLITPYKGYQLCTINVSSVLSQIFRLKNGKRGSVGQSDEFQMTAEN